MNQPEGDGFRPGPVLVRVVVIFVLVGVGTALAQAYADLGLWALLLGAGMLAVAAVVTVEGVGRALRQVWHDRPPALRGRSGRAVVGALAVGSAVLVFVAVVGPPFRPLPVLPSTCDLAPHFTVVTTEDDLGTAQELIAAFERDRAADGGGCPTATGFAYATTAAALATGLAQNWQPVQGDPTAPVPGRDIGTRPDLWMTTSSLAVETLGAGARPGAPTLSDGGPVATSPIVLAAPGPAEQVGTAGMSWNDLLDHPPLPDVVRADPQQSVDAALATAGLYGIDVDATGRTPHDVPTRDERTIETFLARSAVAASYPQGTEADLLCRARRAGGAPAALVVSEQAMVRFNLGRPVDQCPALSRPPGPGLVLHAFYPRTPALDQRSVLLRWSGQDTTASNTTASNTTASDAAAEFDRWLRSDRSHDALRCAGLRPIGAPHQAACPWPGTLDQVSAPAPAVNPTTMAVRVLGGQRVAAPQRRTELLADVSGSMAAPAAGGGTRLSSVAAGVAAAVGGLRGDDALGLRVFPGDPAATGGRDVVPPGPASVTGSASAAALAGATPSGNTPLYASVVQAVDALRATSAGQVDRVVLVTDGDDTSSTISSAQVLGALQSSGIRLRVVIVGNEVTCAAALFRDLAPTAVGGCEDPSSGATSADALRRAMGT